MDTTTDKELILNSLYRDRDELSTKLNDIEKLIKKIKSNNLALNSTPNITSDLIEPVETATTDKQELQFPYKSELRFQVLGCIDAIGTACKLKDIQEKYKEFTGSTFSLRETLKTLHKYQVIKLLRIKGSDRGSYWVKNDWLEDNQLLDKYKFYGFDVIYKVQEIEFI